MRTKYFLSEISLEIVRAVLSGRIVEDPEGESYISALPALSLLWSWRLPRSPAPLALSALSASNSALTRPAPPPALGVGVEGAVSLPPLEWLTVVVLVILKLRQIKAQLRLSVSRGEDEAVLLEILLLEASLVLVVVASQEAGEEAEEERWCDG